MYMYIKLFGLFTIFIIQLCARVSPIVQWGDVICPFRDIPIELYEVWEE